MLVGSIYLNRSHITCFKCLTDIWNFYYPDKRARPWDQVQTLANAPFTYIRTVSESHSSSSSCPKQNRRLPLWLLLGEFVFNYWQEVKALAVVCNNTSSIIPGKIWSVPLPTYKRYCYTGQNSVSRLKGVCVAGEEGITWPQGYSAYSQWQPLWTGAEMI